MKLDCPKCGSPSSWLTKTRNELEHRCYCGYLKVIFCQLETIVIEHSDSGSDVRLPRKGTKLWDTLMILTVEDEANSGDITDRLNQMGKLFSVSDVSSYLTILKSKGLVITLNSRRGVARGSTWTLTDRASDLLGLNIEQ